MLSIHPLIATAMVVSVTGLPAVPAQAAQHAVPPMLVGIRAAHQHGLDRLVFEFHGRLPAQRDVRYVSKLIADGSGQRVNAVGSALLQIRFDQADGHNRRGKVTYGPSRRTYALPGVIQVVNTGDFEATLTFGVGLAKRVPYRVYTLTAPSRVVVDIATPYRNVPVHEYFLNTANYNTGRRPYTTAVQRPVIPPATAFGALQRLFAGPTQAERAQGLRFIRSKATGFSKLTVKNGVARVYLTGRVTSGGSTFTITNQIRPTLKQFPLIKWGQDLRLDGAE
ncbi:AMIN-like domain-containing (lipo)protein [Nonomuraea aurantiaca]|uniref:AMIN-like domain-containing (lipo)protein n=1 Tax=Nonomuraea aurantiaca TaxID=2878562 RepID=UPI001CD99501|nr:GerMN domain-containing protein [Nonomuraea aurantiaca]MCA2229227.1 GerMN domain-containing protein [Nonomuraea aurantiaca]